MKYRPGSIVTTNPGASVLRQPQIRDGLRTRFLRALRTHHEAGDVVHLQSEQVADAVRKEHAREPGGDGIGCAGNRDDPGFMQ